MGEEAVREMAEPPAYDTKIAIFALINNKHNDFKYRTECRQEVKKLLVSMRKEEREIVRNRYKMKIPGPLSHERLAKHDAIKRHCERKQITELFPSGKASN